MNLDELIPPVQQLHAIAAHLPVAIAFLGVLAVVAAVFIPPEKSKMRWAVVSLYLLLAVTAYVATETGEDARAQVSGAIAPSISETIVDHANMAERVWIFALVTAVIVGASNYAKDQLRIASNVMAIVASACTAVWVGFVGHHGGTLVYEHGIGIPPDKVVEWRINPPEPGSEPELEDLEEEEDRVLIPIREFTKAEAEMVSWSKDVVPIFEEACLECHKPGDLDSELDMTTVQGLLKGGEKYGAAIIPGKPDESTTVKYIRGELLPQMPEDDFPLLEDQLHIIRMWIAAGAKDDTAAGDD